MNYQVLRLIFKKIGGCWERQECCCQCDSRIVRISLNIVSVQILGNTNRGKTSATHDSFVCRIRCNRHLIFGPLALRRLCGGVWEHISFLYKTDLPCTVITSVLLMDVQV